MLLGIDVGNTNTVIGALDGLEVKHLWRVSTIPRTTDEFGLALLQLLKHEEIAIEDVEGVAVCCVVPSVLYAIEKAVRRYLKCEVLVVGRGIKTGMRVRTDNPREVGADRIVNAVAAFEDHGGPLVVVDFGTATTFDCVGASGDYIGGAIAPALCALVSFARAFSEEARDLFSDVAGIRHCQRALKHTHESVRNCVCVRAHKAKHDARSGKRWAVLVKHTCPSVSTASAPTAATCGRFVRTLCAL